MSGPDQPQRSRRREAIIRERVRSLLHEFYIEIATTKMSKAKFEEFIDKFIEAAAKDDDAG